MALNLCKLNWTAVSSISFQKRRFTPARAIYRQPVESLIRGCSFSSKKRFPRGGTQLSNSIRHSIRITSELALVKIISIKFQGNDYQIGVYRVNFGWNLVDSCLKSLTCSTETWSNICTDNFVSFSFFGGLIYIYIYIYLFIYLAVVVWNLREKRKNFERFLRFFCALRQWSL